MFRIYIYFPRKVGFILHVVDNSSKRLFLNITVKWTLHTSQLT